MELEEESVDASDETGEEIGDGRMLKAGKGGGGGGSGGGRGGLGGSSTETTDYSDYESWSYDEDDVGSGQRFLQIEIIPGENSDGTRLGMLYKAEFEDNQTILIQFLFD